MPFDIIDDELLLDLMISMDYSTMINFKNSKKGLQRLYKQHKDYIYLKKIYNNVHCIKSTQDIYLNLVKNVSLDELCVKYEKYDVTCSLSHVSKLLYEVGKNKSKIFSLIQTLYDCLDTLPELNSNEGFLTTFKTKFEGGVIFSDKNLQYAWELYKPKFIKLQTKVDAYLNKLTDKENLSESDSENLSVSSNWEPDFD